MKILELFKKIKFKRRIKTNNYTMLNHLEYPKCSISDLIIDSADKHPKLIAYEYYGNKYTYKRFKHQIEECAKSLKTLGVKKDDRVTLCMPNTPEVLIMFYAVNMVGAVANMVHPLSSEKEIEFALNLTKSKIVLTSVVSYNNLIKVVKNTKVKTIIYANIEEKMNLSAKAFYYLTKGRKIKLENNEMVLKYHDFINKGKFCKEFKITRKDKEAAAIIYSGGTTGNPKGILLSNLNINAIALQAYNRCNPVKPGDSILAILPNFHSFGLTVGIHTPLYIGMKCILVPEFKARKFAGLIRKYRPTLLIGVPTLYEALVKSSIGKKHLSQINCMISGGDKMSSDLKARLDKFMISYNSNVRVREGYGLTECSGATCLMPSDVIKNESIGLPFPDIKIKIVKLGTYIEANTLEEGEICISGPTVMMEYVCNQVETIKVLRRHDDKKLWLHTGDMGKVDSDGFIYFTQRLKRMIVSSGYNIYPSHIENIINECDCVLTSFVIGIPHPYKMQVAKAFIVLKEGFNKNESEKTVKEHCSINLAKYSMPYKYEFINELPLTKVGKVDLSALEKY